MSTDHDSPAVEGVPPPFQFSLGTLFWVTTATAIVCALSFSIPSEVALPIMLFISVAILPAVWTTVIIYGRGYQRTFGIGATFPAGILLLSIPFGSLFRGGQMRSDQWLRIVLSAFWISSILVGVLCIGVRRLARGRAMKNLLLSIILVLLLVCAATFRMPAKIAVPIMLFISEALLPAVWTTAIIYGRAYQRTFGIGAVFPSAILILSLPVIRSALFLSQWEGMGSDDFWVRLLLFGFWVSSFLVGAVCMGVRRLVEKRQTP